MISVENNVQFINAHGTIERQVPRLVTVKNLDAHGERPASQPWKAGLHSLQALVKSAQQEGQSITPLGSAWSMSPVIDPTDVLLETKYLNEIPAIGLEAHHVVPSYDQDRAGLVFVQGGTSIARLHRELAQRGRALKTSGESCGQSIAGAISTGTHGSAFKTGSIHDSVVGLHVVTEGGRSVWLESASRPVASDALLSLIEAERVEVDLFEEALVSLGSCGIIAAVLLETYPLYLLKRYREKHPLDRVLANIKMQGGHVLFPSWTLLRAPELLHHYELILNPNRPQSATVQTMYWSGRAVDYVYDDLPATADPAGSSVVAEISHLIDAFGALSNLAVLPRIAEEIATLYPDTVQPEQGVLGELFPRIEFPRGGLAMEIGVSAEHVGAAVELVIDQLRAPAVAFPGLLAVRFVKGSKARLAFSRFPVTCTIEAVALTCAPVLAAFSSLQDALAHQPYEHTLHWGMHGDFSAQRVLRMYGAERVQKFRAARRALLGEAGLRRFSHRLLEASGLGSG